IKFRMWDFENQEMISGDHLAFELYAPLTDLLTQKGIMQCTGLKDKKDNEIYEGDILAWITEDKKIRLKNIIVYSHASFNHKWLDKRTAKVRGVTEEAIFGNVDTGFEIIGNVYENPELV
ncbi:MAG: YopX family protein, partial [Candidatus Paceibacterota bacterium]